MFKRMRIPIREQLGLLVLFTSLIALAVVAIATVGAFRHIPRWLLIVCYVHVLLELIN
jgi:Tfp pilus assembly protein PilX